MQPSVRLHLGNKMTQRFLVKMVPYTGQGVVAFASDPGIQVRVKARALFQSIGRTPGQGVAPTSAWHIVEPEFALESMNPWDVCHALVSDGLALDTGKVRAEFAEPDLEQSWIGTDPATEAFKLAGACEADGQKLGGAGFPGDPENDYWYQDNAHSQFADADVAALGTASSAVRVAHLDTGYDRGHASTPSGLERQLERNFVDDDRPDDASDDTSGFFNNLGHGTGTLSILAGQAIAGTRFRGAAPHVRVVPIRVANRVVLFRNSAISAAFDYVHGLCANPATSVDVITMSMGGLASQAWADAINALYDAGVVVVTAAGNNFGGLPTNNIVFPARFHRVIAACGVMANHKPYADLPVAKMAGNYGPASKMRTALAACTPNVPWAKFGCGKIIDFDGSGTSAATPQIAAAVALWIAKNKSGLEALPQKWMRVEAVRHAILGSAMSSDADRLGKGELRVQVALGQPVVPPETLEAEKPDSASFSFLRVLTGFGIEAVSAKARRMLELEALQLSQSAEIERLLPDPNVDLRRLTSAQRTAIAAALAAHPRASHALKRALNANVPSPPPHPHDAGLPTIEQAHLRNALLPVPPAPQRRRLRVYAYDPSLGRQLETVGLNETVTSIRWEADLRPGPVGEYIEVVDVDPASNCCYAPLDLNDPRLLATDGLRPSEGNPQFHQQMVYAVAMRTIELFEKALGRVALWSPRYVKSQDPNNLTPRGRTKVLERYVQRLRIYPHALRTKNAFYSPQHKALLLGYFTASAADTGAASEAVFTALSHDIVAHETTHALLDGIHRRYQEATNPDVLAFHEAFADIVALFQHFTMADSLRDQIARARGDLSRETLLAQLAVQFGQAEQRRALRDYIGKEERDPTTQAKVWKPREANVTDYQNAHDPHDRGAVLVAAVFDAFVRIYRKRAIVPIRLETNGSEILSPGALSSQLADALTEVAGKSARHVLIMCIRALDYCPPVDITFGDYLRAIITADLDLVPDDPLGYRVAFVSAFRARGIYPENVTTVAVDTLCWEPPPLQFKSLSSLLPKLKLHWDLSTSRHDAWKASRDNATAFRNWLRDAKLVSDAEIAILGLHRLPQPDYPLAGADGEVTKVDLRGIEVHAVRPLRRIGPDGQLLAQLVVEITQSLHTTDGRDLTYRGGATLIIDLNKGQASYMVRKRVDQVARVSRQQALWSQVDDINSDNYTGWGWSGSEPFALLHKHHRGAK